MSSRGVKVRLIVGALVGAAMIPTYMALAQVVPWAHLDGWLPIVLGTVLMACIPGYAMANIADCFIGLAQFLDPMYVLLNAVIYGASWLGLTSTRIWNRLLVGVSWAVYLGWMCVELVSSRR